MKGPKLSLIVLMSAAATAAAAEPRNALFCGSGRLDLACPAFAPSAPVRASLIGFEPLAARNAHQAYVIRYGEGKNKDAEPRWIVQLGAVLHQVLFWAAVASVLL